MPTGTGKTLCILSSILAFIEKYENHYCLIYATRTHTQIKQIIRELKLVPNNHITTILGAKERMCINKNLIQESNIEMVPLNDACKQAIL